MRSYCPVVGLINMRMVRAMTEYMRARPWTVLFVAVFFIPVYASFYLATAPIYPSPDERTLAVFAQTWSVTGNFRQQAPADVPFLPRSVSLFEGNYVPSGFLGLFLLIGLMWRLFGSYGAWLLVPTLAAFAPLALFTVWKHLFSVRVAWLATVILWLFPAWFYYAGRGFLPNVAFIAFIAFALAAFVYAETQTTLKSVNRVVIYSVGGFCVGLAASIRPVEMLWAYPIFLLCAVAFRPCWRRWVPAVLIAGIPIVILAYWQAHTYGAWSAVGYVAPQVVETGGAGSVVSVGAQLLTAWFPFGVHPIDALVRFVQYLVFVYWWAFPWAVIGLVAFVKMSPNSRAHKMYAAAFFIISTYLVLYYGSWPISDHPDQQWMSIGVAYNRYWLPIFVLAMPFLVLGVDAVSRRLPVHVRTWIWAGIILCGIAQTTVLGPDSLWALRMHSVEYTAVADWVMQQTTPDTVVIANREEKFVWPSRIVWFQPDQTYDFATVVGERSPDQSFVWLTQLPSSHVADLQQRIFAPAHVELQLQSQFQSYALYVLKPSAHR